MIFAKIGSGFYIAWGLLHLKAAYDEFVLGAGHVAFFPGILGPVFWISAAIFSTIGIRSKTTGKLYPKAI